LLKMRFERVILLAFIISFVSAGLFGDSPEVERRKKRQEDVKKQRNQKVKQPSKPKKKLSYGEEEDEDKPIDSYGIQEILSDPENIDTVTEQDNPKLKNDEIYKIWE